MENPITYLGSLLGKPQQEQAPNERLRLTWLKRDFAILTLDAIQDQLLTHRMTTAEDMAQFKSVLAGYAGYLHYVGTLNSQLDHLSGGPFTDEPAITSHRDAVLDDALSNQASQEVAVEVYPFIEQ